MNLFGCQKKIHVENTKLTQRLFITEQVAVNSSPCQRIPNLLQVNLLAVRVRLGLGTGNCGIGAFISCNEFVLDLGFGIRVVGKSF